jgi:hypothetical protein
MQELYQCEFPSVNVNDLFDYDKNIESISKYILTYMPEYSLEKNPDIINNLLYAPCISNLKELLNNYNIKLYIGCLNTLVATMPWFQYQMRGPTYTFYTDHDIVITVTNLMALQLSSTKITIKSIEDDEINFELNCLYDGIFKCYHPKYKEVKIDLYDEDSTCLDSLSKAKKYIHPSIYIDHLLHSGLN